MTDYQPGDWVTFAPQTVAPANYVTAVATWASNAHAIWFESTPGFPAAAHPCLGAHAVRGSNLDWGPWESGDPTCPALLSPLWPGSPGGNNVGVKATHGFHYLLFDYHEENARAYVPIVSINLGFMWTSVNSTWYGGSTLSGALACPLGLPNGYEIDQDGTYGTVVDLTSIEVSSVFIPDVDSGVNDPTGALGQEYTEAHDEQVYVYFNVWGPTYPTSTSLPDPEEIMATWTLLGTRMLSDTSAISVPMTGVDKAAIAAQIAAVGTPYYFVQLAFVPVQVFTHDASGWAPPYTKVLADPWTVGQHGDETTSYAGTINESMTAQAVFTPPRVRPICGPTPNLAGNNGPAKIKWKRVV